MKINLPLDHRKKYYLILDCETATLPCAMDYEEEIKNRVAIAKPLIYDIAWQVTDRNGNIYRKKSFVIAEIFSVPSIFNTAYYKEKRPIYIERLRNQETEIVSWYTATDELVKDLACVEGVGAYNSMFDFKKAIPFTESYIANLYSKNYDEWYERQKQSCERIANNEEIENNREFQKDIFTFRSVDYMLFDVWGLSCEHILNTDEYKRMCIEKEWKSKSGKYFKTSAETCYRYFTADENFTEKHCAIDDTEIETEIFVEILRRTKNKFEIGIIYFPFRILGKIEDFII